MKTEDARRFAEVLLSAVAQAEAEGRDKLTRADLDRFVAADDAARDELLEAIERAGGE